MSEGGSALSGSFGASNAVVTPDAVGLELPTATVGSRGVAYLLDLLILIVGLLLIGLATALLGGGGFVDGSLGIMILLVLSFAWQFGYPVILEVTTRGRTLGKMAMGLRVVTVEGAPVGFRHAVIRAVVGLLELLATLGAPAVISSLVSARGQRLGDLAAGTMVVRERRVGGPPSAVRFVPPPRLLDYARTLDTSALGASEYATLRDTLQRAPTLPVAVRARVTTRLANLLAAKVSPPPPPGIGPEEWLTSVAAAVQLRTWPPGGRGTGAGFPSTAGASPTTIAGTSPTTGHAPPAPDGRAMPNAVPAPEGGPGSPAEPSAVGEPVREDDGRDAGGFTPPT